MSLIDAIQSNPTTIGLDHWSRIEPSFGLTRSLLKENPNPGSSNINKYIRRGLGGTIYDGFFYPNDMVRITFHDDFFTINFYYYWQ